MSQTIIGILNENPSKLNFLAKIKQDHKFEEYLNIHNFEHRRALTKLRISSHKLEIESGRWNNIQRENRVCKNCLLNKVEDEFHLIFECQMHISERNILFETLQRKMKINTASTKRQEDIIKKVFASKDLATLKPLAH